MSDLTTLIDRVRGLTGPDQEVDVAVLLALGIMTLERRQRDRKEWLYVVGSSYERHDPRMLPARFKLTASLDAVIALIKRELPGHGWFVDSANCAGVHEFDGPVQRGNTPALALLLAFLTVMKEKSVD